MPLVLRDEPQSWESLAGFLLRLSSANDYKSPFCFVRDPRRRQASGSLWSRDVVEVISDIARIDPSLLLPKAYTLSGPAREPVWMRGHTLSPWYVELARPKICPSCLQDRLILLEFWDLTLWLVCPVHGTYLIDMCPHCQQPISWHREHIQFCGKCGRSLISRRGPRAPQLLRDYSKLLAHSFDYPIANGVPPATPFRDLSAADFMRVTRFLGSHAAQKRKHRKTRRYCPLKSEVLQCVERAAPSIMNWPHGFQLFLETLWRGRRHQSKKRLVTDELKLKFQDQHFEFLKTEYRKFLKLHAISGVIGVPVQSPLATSYLPAIEAARRTGASYNRLVAGVRNGAVPGASAHRRGHTKTWVESSWIEAPDSEHQKYRRNSRHQDYRRTGSAGYVSTSVAAQCLGIERSLLRKLADAGFLERVTLGRYCRGISCGSIRRVLVEVDAAAAAHTGSVPDPVSLVQHRKRVPPYTIADLLKAVTHGIVSVSIHWPTATGLRRYAVSSAELSTIDVKLRLGIDWMSIQAAANYIGTSEGTIERLLDHDFLKPADRKRRRRGVSIKSIAQFNRTYLLSSQAAEALGLAAKHSYQRIRAMGIGPAHEIEGRNGRRSLVWRRADVEHAAARYNATHLCQTGRSVGLTVSQG
jgi:hypothetical protein